MGNLHSFITWELSGGRGNKNHLLMPPADLMPLYPKIYQYLLTPFKKSPESDVTETAA